MSREIKHVIWEKFGNVVASQLSGEFVNITELMDVSQSRPCNCAPCKGKGCEQKDGLGISPVTLRPGPYRGTVPLHIGKTGLWRDQGYVVSVNMLMIDIDHRTMDQVTKELDGLELAGITYVAYSTHNHNAPYDCAIRVCIPLDRDVLAHEYPAFLAEAIRKYGLSADPSCKDLCRYFHLGSHKADIGRLPWGRKYAGSDIQVAAILAGIPVAKPVSKPFTTVKETIKEDDQEDKSGSTVMDAIRRALRELKRKKLREKDDVVAHAHGVALGNLLDGKVVQTEPGRDNAWQSLMGLVSFVIDSDTEWDPYIRELCRPSLGHPEASQPEGVDHWLDIVESQYNRAQRDHDVKDAISEAARLASHNSILRALGVLPEPEVPQAPAYDPMKALEEINAKYAAASAQQAAREAAAAAGVPPPPEPVKPPPEPVKADVPAVDPNAWIKDLRWKRDNDGMPTTLEPDVDNLILALENSQEWKGVLHLNMKDKCFECRGSGGPLQLSDRNVNSMVPAIQAWYLQHGGTKFSIETIENALTVVCRRHKYNPVQEMILGKSSDNITVPEWDGVVRTPTFFERYLNVKMTDDYGNSCRTLVEAYSQKWVRSVCARALSAGCQVDTALIFVSKEGFKKTSMFRTLGKDYYSDIGCHVFGSQNQLMAINGSWISEMAEMNSFRSAQASMVKGTITTTFDVFRLPYGKAMERYDRPNVFVGTINDKKFLPDAEGNRRYWVVDVDESKKAINIRKLKEIWPQILAEGRDCVLAGGSDWAEGEDGIRQNRKPGYVPCPECAVEDKSRCEKHMWWLTDSEKLLQEESVEISVVKDESLKIAIQSYWQAIPKADRPGTILNVHNIAIGIGYQINQINDSLQSKIGKVIRSLGFEKKVKRIKGWEVTTYTGTPELNDEDYIPKVEPRSFGNVNYTNPFK